MREIKFRAWDKDEKKMIYDAQDTYDWGACGCKIPASNFGELLKSCPEFFEVMQYTGLKDKNGKEIYEGDILLYELFKGCTLTRWVVTIPNIYISMRDESVNQIEIIGNIYENPDLLRAEGIKIKKTNIYY